VKVCLRDYRAAHRHLALKWPESSSNIYCNYGASVVRSFVRLRYFTATNIPKTRRQRAYVVQCFRLFFFLLTMDTPMYTSTQKVEVCQNFERLFFITITLYRIYCDEYDHCKAEVR
jgi:hypothetical protein